VVRKAQKQVWNRGATARAEGLPARLGVEINRRPNPVLDAEQIRLGERSDPLSELGAVESRDLVAEGALRDLFNDPNVDQIDQRPSRGRISPPIAARSSWEICSSKSPIQRCSTS
jgi:hypothetical protein